jgi:hypothetical protein
VYIASTNTKTIHEGCHTFLIDTGSQITILADEPINKSLGKHEIIGVNGKSKNFASTILTICCYNRDPKSIKAFISQYTPTNILGMDTIPWLLKEHNFCKKLKQLTWHSNLAKYRCHLFNYQKLNHPL